VTTPRKQFMAMSPPYSSALMLLRCRTFGGPAAGKALNCQGFELTAPGPRNCLCCALTPAPADALPLTPLPMRLEVLLTAWPARRTPRFVASAASPAPARTPAEPRAAAPESPRLPFTSLPVLEFKPASADPFELELPAPERTSLPILALMPVRRRRSRRLLPQGPGRFVHAPPEMRARQPMSQQRKWRVSKFCHGDFLQDLSGSERVVTP
jgi:hypothetical protein